MLIKLASLWNFWFNQMEKLTFSIIFSHHEVFLRMIEIAKTVEIHDNIFLVYLNVLLL